MNSITMTDANRIYEEQKQRTIDTLHSENCSCAILSGGRISIFRQRGIRDLYQLLIRQPQTLSGAFIADKVVGKGAASLMILGGVSGIFADVISRPALDLLQKTGIELSYGQAAEYIINRAGTGMCPVEALCIDLSTPAECLSRIETFLKSVNK